MTRRELNIKIFEGKANKVLWQPRLETWIYYHRKNNSLPDSFKDLSNFQIYDQLGCSIRYGVNSGLFEYNEEVSEYFEKVIDENHIEAVLRTKWGILRTVYQIVKENENKRIVKFPIENVEQLKILTNLIRNKRYVFVEEIFKESDKRLGNRGAPTIFLSSSGFTDLIKFYAGLLNTFYLFYDYPKEIEEYLDACNERDQRMIDEVLKSTCRIFNLGDHATNEFTPPPILEKYLLPRWQKIGNIMREKNRFVHSHWDGNSKLILKYIKVSGLSGIEALTPYPQCDMQLEEIKQAVGEEIVVLDLIPAIFFLPNYSVDFVLDFTKRVIDMFFPRLILGISDEMPPYGEIKKVEKISEYIYKQFGTIE
ncbi:MAG: uroporphyrinogen decarboxylase family protein [Candidatus Ratteibacteria bacterium]